MQAFPDVISAVYASWDNAQQAIVGAARTRNEFIMIVLPSSVIAISLDRLRVRRADSAHPERADLSARACRASLRITAPTVRPAR